MPLLYADDDDRNTPVTPNPLTRDWWELVVLSVGEDHDSTFGIFRMTIVATETEEWEFRGICHASACGCSHSTLGKGTIAQSDEKSSDAFRHGLQNPENTSPTRNSSLAEFPTVMAYGRRWMKLRFPWNTKDFRRYLYLHGPAVACRTLLLNIVIPKLCRPRRDIPIPWNLAMNEKFTQLCSSTICHPSSHHTKNQKPTSRFVITPYTYHDGFVFFFF